MTNEDGTYTICFECGAVTRVRDNTVNIMKILDLKLSDYNIKCQDCRNNDYYSLLRFARSLERY